MSKKTSPPRVHMTKKMILRTRVGKDEVETNLTFLKDITLDGSPFENLEEGDPISPLEDDIEDYFHIEKEKWEIVGPQFDCAPIYDTDKEGEDEIALPFPLGTIYDDICLCIKRGSWK